jgi:dihydropyrimidinase
MTDNHPLSTPVLVSGGTVVTDGAAAQADVLIRDGRIVAVGDRRQLAAADADVIDATGLMVLPGAVDPHYHPFGAMATDGAGAVCGGTTSAIAFVEAEPGETPAHAAGRSIADELPHSPIDLALHGVIWEPASYKPGDLADLAALGVTSIKLWLAYRELGIMADDDQVHRILTEAASEGILVLAHCENGPVVEELARDLRASGDTSLRHHGRVRPISLEAEAVHRFLRIAAMTGADTYVVHVTGREPLEEIIRARRRGQRVVAETCPHHLVFDEARYEDPDPLPFLMTPPLRSLADQDALWQALADGTLDTLGSDHGHVPMRPDKVDAAGDVTRVPYGIPGVQWRLALAHTYGVLRGRITMERLVEVCCAAPARAYGLFGRKGTVRPGADGDLVLWDPTARTLVSPATRRDDLDYSPYDGLELVGAPRVVLAGGEVVARDGDQVPRTTPSAFLPRAPRGAVTHHATQENDYVAAAR